MTTSSLDFFVLGPLEVRRDGRPVDAGVRRQRLVLGIMLIEPGRLISLDRLTELAWFEQPPPRTARNALQVCVSNLRALLGRDAPIVTSGDGYRLEIDRDAVDMHRFRTMVATARTSDDATAVGLLRAADDLWRGPILGGTFDGPLREHLCAGVEEERRRAVEERIERELHLGRHAGLISELSDLVRCYPTRERVAGQLMLALYRDGRATHALKVFSTVQHTLADELGIDPGPDLDNLHRAILRRAPYLLLTPSSGSTRDGGGRPRVNQLPARTPHFVGRASELTGVAGCLATGTRTGPAIVAVTGMGGIGKTAFAIRAADAALDAYPDGCLFADLRGSGPRPAAPHRVLGSLLRSLGVPTSDVCADPDERLGMFRSVTAVRRVLMVLDDARDAAQLRSLIPGGQGCAVIATSRQDLSAVDAHLIELPLLSNEDSRSLLDHVAGPQRLAGAADAMSDLVRLCGGVPLALRVVAARLTGRSGPTPPQLARLLANAESPLDELTAGDLGVAASLRLSYQRLSPRAAALLRCAALSGQPRFTAADCDALLGGQDAGAAIDELVMTHMVIPDPDARFRLHDLVRMAGRTVGAGSSIWTPRQAPA